MQELPAERFRRHAPLLLLALASLICFGLRARYILFSGYDEVLKGVEDDTYYYLQPAWNFRQLGFYSFDGVGKMYGFQPLWMVVVTAISYLCADKEIFLRATLLLATAFYVGSGFVLYRLVRTGRSQLSAALAVGIFWFLNPWLAEVLTRGKENALHAFLLLVATYLVNGLLTPQGKASAPRLIGLGATVGLLFLARVNSLVFPALFGFGYLIASRRRLLPTARELSWCALGFVAAATPWMLYAQLEFGSAFPVSGAAKLRWFSLENFIELLVPHTLFRIARSIGGVYRDEFPQLFVACMGGLFACFVAFRARRELASRDGLRQLLTRCSELWRTNLGTAALLAYAVANLFMTLVLLSPWFDYGVWYHVPEQCVSVFLVCKLTAYVLDSTADGRLFSGVARPSLARGVGAVLLAYSLVFPFFKRPEHPPYRDWQDRIYPACLEARKLIPKGSAIGAWNSGLLGYMMDGYSVVNLDGLANTRDFLEVIGDNTAGMRVGDDPRMAAYLARRGVTHIVDMHALETLGKGPCFGVVGLDHCEILYRVERPLDFGHGRYLLEVIAKIDDPRAP